MNLRELLKRKNELLTEVRNLSNDNKLDEAEEKMAQVRNINKQIKLAEELDEEETRNGEEVEKEEVEVISQEKRYEQAFSNAITGKATREDMQILEQRALLAGSVDADGGYLIPDDWKKMLYEYKRSYPSLKNLVGRFETGVRTGTIPREDLTGGIAGLTNITEGQDIAESGAKFGQETFAISDWGTIIPVSNTLIADSPLGIVQYIFRLFAKKAKLTENAQIITALKTKNAGTPVTWNDHKDLGNTIVADLDPVLLGESVILTNQSGYAYLDSLEDTTGRPLLQTDHTNRAIKRFKGLPVHYVIDGELPNRNDGVNNFAPFFVGSLKEGCQFVDRMLPTIVTSTEAGFTNNTTKFRVIERFDVINMDLGAYEYGEIQID